jgi:hypothetical protein
MEREGFGYAIASKYKELLPLAHSSLCLCGSQAHSYLWVRSGELSPQSP